MTGAQQFQKSIHNYVGLLGQGRSSKTLNEDLASDPLIGNIRVFIPVGVELIKPQDLREYTDKALSIDLIRSGQRPIQIEDDKFHVN